MDWDDDLGVGRAVAGDMARKLVDVIDELRPVIRHSGSAHAVSDLNLHAGGLALKGAKHKKTVFTAAKAKSNKISPAFTAAMAKSTKISPVFTAAKAHA